MFFFSVFFMFIFILLGVAFFTLFERSVLGYIQFRSGPNSVGVLGLLQPFSDALSLFSKEFIFLYLVIILFLLLVYLFLYFSGFYILFFNFISFIYGLLFFYVFLVWGCILLWFLVEDQILFILY